MGDNLKNAFGVTDEERKAMAAGIEGGVHHEDRKGLAGTKMAAAKAFRPKPQNVPMTHDQLMAKAQQMMEQQRAQGEMLKGGASTGQRDDAGARMPDWLTRPDTDPYMAAGKPSLNDEELEKWKTDLVRELKETLAEYEKRIERKRTNHENIIILDNWRVKCEHAINWLKDGLIR